MRGDKMPDPKEKIVYNLEQTVVMHKLAVVIEKRSGDTDIVDALWQAICIRGLKNWGLSKILYWREKDEWITDIAYNNC